MQFFFFSFASPPKRQKLTPTLYTHTHPKNAKGYSSDTSSSFPPFSPTQTAFLTPYEEEAASSSHIWREKLGYSNKWGPPFVTPPSSIPLMHIPGEGGGGRCDDDNQYNSMRKPDQQRTLSKLPTELRCRNLVNKHRLSMQIGMKACKNVYSKCACADWVSILQVGLWDVGLNLESGVCLVGQKERSFALFVLEPHKWLRGATVMNGCPLGRSTFIRYISQSLHFFQVSFLPLLFPQMEKHEEKKILKFPKKSTIKWRGRKSYYNDKKIRLTVTGKY